jgi:GAF domain-containing protein
MLSTIKHFLETNASDPLLARRQRLLNLVLLGLAVPGFLFGITMLILWFMGKTPITGALAGLGVQPFYALSYWLGRKGKVIAAGYIPVGAVFMAMVFGGFLLGIGHVTYIGFAMATLTASILVGNTGGILIAFLSTLANLVIGTMQNNGQLPSPIDPLTTVVADSIGLGLGLIVLIVFTGIYNLELQNALFTQQALSSELQVNTVNLESQVRRRTRDLEKRLMQIRAAAEISRTISAVLDAKELLQQVVDLVQQRFNLYYVGVFLLDDEKEYAMLQAGTGEAGRAMLRDGHRLAVGGNSMIGWTTFNRKPRIALDVGLEAVRFNNPYLPETHSELALPILSGNRCLGALTVQSGQPNAFDQDDITILQSIADGLAVALENARLFQQAQSNLNEIRSLHGQYLTQAWGKESHQLGQLAYLFENGQTGPKEGETQQKDFSITLRDQIIGNLTIESGDHSLSPEEIAFIDTVTTETAIALENARLLDETQRRAEHERLLTELSEKVRSSSEVDVVLRTAILELGRALHASEGIIQLAVED